MSFGYLGKLPGEIRIKIYELVLCQSLEKYAKKKTYGSNLHVQKLFTLSRCLYWDAMAFYFSSKHFRFSNLTRLGNFLATIGPHARQHITKVSFVYGELGASAAIRLLASCPNLQHMSFFTLSSDDDAFKKPSLTDKAGYTELLSIRGLKTLNIEIMNRSDSQRVLDDNQLFKEALQVLKKPYSAAAMKRRAARGIMPQQPPRTHFGATPEVMTMAEWRVRASWLLRNSPETEHLLLFPAYHAVERPGVVDLGCVKGVTEGRSYSDPVVLQRDSSYPGHLVRSETVRTESTWKWKMDHRSYKVR